VINYEQVREIPEEVIKDLVELCIEEDMPFGDKTAEGIFSRNDVCKAYIEAESEIVIAGIKYLKYFFDESVKIQIFKKDGEFCKKGERIAEMSGFTIEILSKERSILNFIQRLSGIATQANKYAKIGSKYGVKILDTRKTTPGLRTFEKYAVRCGGACNHRTNLSTGILIKDNHIQAAGSIKDALLKIKEKNFGLPIELEVENFEQIKEALEIGIDGFLLDNMNPEKTIEAVKFIRNTKNGDEIFIESSGGITYETLEEYCKTGVNAISIGALTHSVKAADIHMEFEM
jgi:nicotinate-nucleotide pyrophosphorylase (carboxylating)